MAMRKTSSAHVLSALTTRDEWLGGNGLRVKTASEVLSQYDPQKWLLSHATIMASVDVELAKADDPKSDYYILPEHSQFVNNNGDCWERELLAKTYRTFIGANNYVEHVQIPEMSKGKIVDAALREVDLGVGPDGNKLSTLYVDLLVATSWKFPDICQKVLSGEYNAMSMGCLIAYSRCSRCGNVAADEAHQCEHVRFYRRNTFYDEFGRQRITAEICGHKDDPSSVTFIDASWVRRPAFPGAVVRNVVAPPASVLQITSPSGSADPLMKAVKDRLTINTTHHDTDRFAKAASLKVAEDPAPTEEAPTSDGAARFEDPAEKPVEDAGFPEMPEGDGSAMGDPSADPAAPEAPETPKTSPEEANATPFEDIRKSIEDSVLTQTKQILLDKVMKAVSKPTDDQMIGDGINRYTDVTRQGESLVKEASSPSNAKYLRDRYSIDISEIQSVKLASSLLAFAVSPELGHLRKFGFTRKEAVEVLHFVDARRNGNVPLSNELVNYVTKKAGKAGKDYTVGFTCSAVRRPSDREKLALQLWPKLLEGFN